MNNNEPDKNLKSHVVDLSKLNRDWNSQRVKINERIRENFTGRGKNAWRWVYASLASAAIFAALLSWQMMKGRTNDQSYADLDEEGDSIPYCLNVLSGSTKPENKLEATVNFIVGDDEGEEKL
jgi:hypothetical protein